MTSTLIISFIRDLKNSKHDDCMVIAPSTKLNNLYNIEYRDRLNSIRNKSICTESEVLDMVENMFNLLPHDQDPFNYIQVTAPSFPPVLMETKSLANFDVRESIYSVVRSTLRNWPSTVSSSSTVTTSDRPVTRSQTRVSTA